MKINKIILLLVSVVSSNVLYAQNHAIFNVSDPAMETPHVNTENLSYYSYENLDYAMTIGIERTQKGRMWACWVGGGDSEDAFFVLNKSDDNGKTWSDPIAVIDPHHPDLDYKRCSLVGCLWIDPSGKLWIFFDQSMTSYDGRSGLWYTTCENPDSDKPVWSEPKRIWHGRTLNKPIVLSDNTWAIPVSLWQRDHITKPFADSYHELDSLRMAHMFISTDKGKTWEKRGSVSFPNTHFDEHHIVELKDGTLWMTARTKDGIYESKSNDKGKTWTTPRKYMEHISSRHFIRRLKSGNLLLVKHGDLDEKTRTRSKLKAYLSEDDGKTWKGGLMLDERRGISYPDGFQSPDGKIYVSYDRNRGSDGDVLLAVFSEKDILTGEFVDKGSKNKVLISRPKGLDILPPPSERMYK